MKRRILSILLLAALVIGLLPQGIFSVRANDDDIVYPVEGGNLYFDKMLYDMGIGSVAYCDDTITKAVIPAQIDGVAVTTIGDYAFCGCSKLTSVTIPEGVTTIRDCAFRECENLTEINLPDSISQVGDGIFWNTAIYNAPDRWIDDVLYLDNWVIEAKQTLSGDYAIRSGTVGIADGAFSRCGELTSVTIPGSVQQISAYAFYLCSSLTEVTVGSGTAEIGESAFCDCGSLTSVVLPDSVTSIGDRAFCGCGGLTGITLPDGLTYIGDAAFSGCRSLTSINIPDSVAYVGGGTLWGTGIYKADDRWIGGVLYLDHWLIDATAVTGEYSIQKGTKGIASGAFAHCVDLTCVILPEGVKYICGGAFYGCIGLTGIVLPDSVTDINYKAFFDCDALRTVYFMGDAPALEENAFKMLAEDGWTEVNIPGLTLYYIDGKAGWTSPTWNGYPTSTWMPADYYADVSEKAWYHDAVQYASQNGLMNGVGGGKFDPEGSMTRAMLVTVLWRYAGEPTGNKNSFTDVPDGLWYTDAVAWAAANGIVSGVGNGKFDPEGNITREQMATILFRYAQKNCIDTSKRGDLSVFPDKGDISSWAKDAVQWAVAEKIINGSDGKLLPLGNATRAQVAAILMRFIENIAENKLHAKRHTEVIDPAVAATCTQSGKTEGKHCDLCGAVLVAQETVAALGHDYGAWTQTKAPTCTEKGEEKRICSRCNAFETREIAAHGHTEVVDAAVPATCTEKGKTEGKHCTVCGTVIVAQEEIPSLGHNYGAWTQTKAPTCTEKGEEKRICSRCDAFETREIAAHGHTEVVDAAVPATCTQSGKTEGKHCDLCGTVLVAQETVAALGHDFGAWTQTKAPTCTEKGEEKRTCSRCDAFETREIAATGHTEVIDPAVAATCTQSGKTEGKHCDLCGTVLVAQKTVAALGHNYEAWTQTKAPTCTEKGEEKRTCSRCNAFETREIAAHGHTEVVDAAVPATCTQAGKTEGKHCTVCGTVIVAQEEIPSLGHDYGAWTQTKAPTCTEKGEEKRTCSRCNAFETREIAAHGHTEVVDAAVPATCTQAGKTEGKHCSACNAVLVAQETVAALGHDFGAWTQTKTPTCTEKGEEKRLCSRCDAFEAREIAAHGHTEVVDAAVPATCTEKGKTEGKHCTVCGTVIVAQEEIPSLGHDYGAWTQTKTPTCTEKGEEKHLCSRCDAFETREIAATGHTEVIDPAAAATCTEAGKTEGKHCAVCNTVLIAQETIPALGHDYGDWTQTKEPTCTEQGEEKRVCSRCDAFETRALAVVDPKHVLTAGTRKMYIGMSLELLLEYAGEPEEILSTTSGYTWYVYGTEGYTDFVMAGVYENKVVAICASGADFSYRGCTAYGSVAEAEEGDTYHITILKDKNDNSAIYGILLTDNQFRVQYTATEAALAGESRVAFHLANAFRVLHEVSILEWCDNAATAARLHCEDMATNDYCAHTSLDGRQFYMRLKENGVLYRYCSENLCAGYYSGIGAHNAWVNSSGHRANLLSTDINRCGVGFAYGADSYYRYYAVTDYYHTR